MAGLGLVVLRLALALVFVAHGAQILFGTWSGPGIGAGGLQNTAALYAALGLHPEFLLAILAGVVQLAGGLLIAGGMMTRGAASALVVYLFIGVWKVHLHWGLFLNWIGAPGRGHGIEYSLVLIGALVCLILGGGGEWSVDGWRAHSRDRLAAGRARLRGKL